MVTFSPVDPSFRMGSNKPSASLLGWEPLQAHPAGIIMPAVIPAMFRKKSLLLSISFCIDINCKLIKFLQLAREVHLKEALQQPFE
jgi:hypothetical protein